MKGREKEERKPGRGNLDATRCSRKEVRLLREFWKKALDIAAAESRPHTRPGKILTPGLLRDTTCSQHLPRRPSGSDTPRPAPPAPLRTHFFILPLCKHTEKEEERGLSCENRGRTFVTDSLKKNMSRTKDKRRLEIHKREWMVRNNRNIVMALR